RAEQAADDPPPAGEGRSRTGGGADADLPGGGALGLGPPRGGDDDRAGEAGRAADRLPRRRRGPADLRRLRLHRGDSGADALPRRPPPPDRRRHRRGAARDPRQADGSLMVDQRVALRQEARRREVMVAAVAVFSEQGYRATSMTDIAERLGMGKAS